MTMQTPELPVLPRRRRCDVCVDTHFVSNCYVYAREAQCTCGAGDDELAFHTVSCDSVPCPFCQLLTWPISM
jgi:hypothetical protein